jgi:uncharacterized membrane protein
MARKRQHEDVICSICQEQKSFFESIPVESLSQPLIESICRMHPDWCGTGFICTADLNHIRAKHIRNVLETDKGELSALEEQVMKSLREQDILSKNINVEFDEKLTLGERFADKLADYAGSWRFISIFMGILLLWIVINSIIIMVWKPFDPYPFILLNLVLSCIAALQAPVIMMSQNRQEAKDRLRSEHDYMVNLKAELEIRHLHDKIDHLIVNQWQRLLEIQEIQVELMEELANENSRRRAG